MRYDMNLNELEDGDVGSVVTWLQTPFQELAEVHCTVLECLEPVWWTQTVEWTIGELRNSTQLYWCKEHAQAYSPKEGDKEG